MSGAILPAQIRKFIASEVLSAIRVGPINPAICFELVILTSVAHEHDLARHAFLPEQLVRASCLGKRKALRDERPDLLLLKEVKQGDQILPKQSRLQPFERLNAVGDHPFPARKKPAAGDVQRVDGDSM